MLDHLGITVSDLKRSDVFYEAALKPLGIAPVMRFGTFVGYGIGRPTFWIGEGKSASTVPAIHIAFPAASRALVDQFYKAAIAAGGRDNGAPGLRPHYHANYYGAFVLDFDGYNVEAVCHAPE